ncbi:MAG: nuclear transport factor 2 family protein [Syntrophus sp. (in: bacteria)]
MKNTILLSIIILAFIFLSFSKAYSATADADNKSDMVKEEVWALEEAYFTNLYKADYEGMLAIVHGQFLGWPAAVPQPIDKDESARFMKQIAPKPTSCTFKIERSGIRFLGEVALTQYTIHVNCCDIVGEAKTQSSRITHTWVKEGPRWKLLGGMSYDK